MAEPGGPHGPSLGPPTFISGGPGPPLLNFEFCLDVVSLSNTISIGSSIKANRLMKKMLQNSGSISSTLFLIWQRFRQDSVIVWQNTHCTVCLPAMDYLPHWCY